MLSHARFDARPWIIVDFKREEFWDHVGFPPLQILKIGQLPKKNDRGLFVCFVNPGEDAAVDAWLWKIWERGNIGLFFDEANLLPGPPKFTATQAIMRQGRSKRLPVIACTQRPSWTVREIISEADYYGVFRLNDARDRQVIEGFVPFDLDEQPPLRHWRWYDVGQNALFNMAPVSGPDGIRDRLRDRVPYRWSPFRSFLHPAA